MPGGWLKEKKSGSRKFVRGRCLRDVSCDHPSDGGEHLSPCRCLAERVCTACLTSLPARLRVVMGGDKNHRCLAAFGGEMLPQTDAGHSAQLDIQHQTIELRRILCLQKQ